MGRRIATRRRRGTAFCDGWRFERAFRRCCGADLGGLTVGWWHLFWVKADSGLKERGDASRVGVGEFFHQGVLKTSSLFISTTNISIHLSNTDVLVCEALADDVHFG